MKKSKYKLKINGCPIELKLVPEIVLLDEATGEEQRPLGLCSPSKSKIKVVDTLESELQRRVILHELIHNWLVPFSLDLQEHAIDILAYGIIETANKNKEFMRELLKL